MITILRSLIRNSTQLLVTINNKQSNLTTTNHHLLRFLHKPIAENPQDFTVSYLVNSCGLTYQSALSTAKKIQLKTAENPDSVLNFLKSHDFTNTQITNVVTKCPKLLSLSFDKTIKPKLEYLKSVGFDGTDLAAFVSAVPYILMASLENRLKPNFELLFSIIGNNQLIASAVRQSSWLLHGSLKVNFLPNVRTLQSFGIPDTSIAKLATLHPRTVLMPTVEFMARVQLIRKMGFDPLSTMFIHAVAVASRVTPSMWDRKVALFKSLGWLDTEVILAFAKHPHIMGLSDVKFRKMMEFYGQRLQWGPSYLSAYPIVMSFSLEKRVMPRVLVMSMLASKGLVTFNSTASFLIISKKDFLNKYVITYKNQVPDLLETYKVNLETVEPMKGSATVKGS